MFFLFFLQSYRLDINQGFLGANISTGGLEWKALINTVNLDAKVRWSRTLTEISNSSPWEGKFVPQQRQRRRQRPQFGQHGVGERKTWWKLQSSAPFRGKDLASESFGKAEVLILGCQFGQYRQKCSPIAIRTSCQTVPTVITIQLSYCLSKYSLIQIPATLRRSQQYSWLLA